MRREKMRLIAASALKIKKIEIIERRGSKGVPNEAVYLIDTSI